MEIKPINWQLVSHPVNWFTIFFMLVIAGIGGHLLLTYLGIEPRASNLEPPTSGQSSTPPPATAISSYAGRTS